MPAHQGQTDEILKVTLTSRILGASWMDAEAAAGGKAAYEVKTQYVGDGAPIKVTFKDLEGKTLATVEGAVLSNLHRGLFTSPAANATGGVTIEAELPKHGLKAAGGRLKTGKPIEFSALRFTDPEGNKALTRLPEGKPAACEARVKGLREGDKVLVSVHLRTDRVMQDGHLFLEGEVPVKDGKAILLFRPKVKTRLDAIRIQADLDKEGGTYFQPEYVFACRAGGVRTVSEPAKAVQELTLNFWEFPGQAGSLEGKQVAITGPDGQQETRTIPKDGTIVIPDAKPGQVTVKGDFGTPLKTTTDASPQGGPPEGLGEITWEEAKDISVQVTQKFEGEYDTVAGNFDGQGISFGIIQWNFGTGTLAPLFLEFSKDAAAFKACFGTDAARHDEFLDMLRKTPEKQVEWAEGIQEEKEVENSDGKKVKKWVVDEAWKGCLQKLGQNQKFQGIQKRTAVRKYGGKAKKLIDWIRTLHPGPFGKVTLRGWAALFDMVVQQGGLSSAEMTELAKLLKDEGLADQGGILKRITDYKGSKAKGERGKYRPDCVSRRWGILAAAPVKVTRQDMDGKDRTSERKNPDFKLLEPDKIIKDL